jgi:hypothetical protein
LAPALRQLSIATGESASFYAREGDILKEGRDQHWDVGHLPQRSLLGRSEMPGTRDPRPQPLSWGFASHVHLQTTATLCTYIEC